MNIDNIITIVIGIVMASLIAASVIVGFLYHAKIISSKVYNRIDAFIKDMKQDISSGSITNSIDSGAKNSILNYLDNKSKQYSSSSSMSKKDIKVQKLSDKLSALKSSEGK